MQKSILFEITVKKGRQETNYYINDQPDDPVSCIGAHNALFSVVYFLFFIRMMMDFHVYVIKVSIPLFISKM
jgi:hypothetical protein